MRFYDPDDDHYSEIYTENVTTTAGHRSVWNNTTDNGAVSIQTVSLADDGIGTFDTGNGYAIVHVVNNYNPTAFAHIGVTGTQAPVDYGSGSLVSTGAANPDVDGNVNIYTAAGSGILSIKNRLGSTRKFYVFVMSGTA